LQGVDDRIIDPLHKKIDPEVKNLISLNSSGVQKFMFRAQVASRSAREREREKELERERQSKS